jgi:putative PIN family toxin of toxin-antitoxin system
VRVVLDSSVLVAAFITRAGVCAELFEAALTNHHLVVSDFILDEVRRKLSGKFGFPPTLVAQLIQQIAAAAERVEPVAVPPETCRDPGDLAVIGTAIGGRAVLLVSVDKDILAVGQVDRVRIVTPGGFWHATRGATP